MGIVYVLIISIILFSLMVVSLDSYPEYYDKHKKLKIVCWILACIFLLMIISAVYLNDTLWENSDREWVAINETSIVALKDNLTTENRRVRLGVYASSNYIDSTMYYYCAESTSNGYNMIKIPAMATSIIETNDISPKIVTVRDKWSNEKLKFWIGDSYTIKYYIYVPKGTIDTVYKIDME